MIRHLAIVALVAGAAHAGRSELAWLGSTETLPARTAEAQVRITDRDDLGDTRIRETMLWIGAQIGITDRLELTLPVETSYLSAVGVEPDFALRRYGAELRYRFVDRGRALVPVVRFGVHDDVVRPGVTRAELDGALSYVCGRMFAAVELGVTADASRGGLFVVLRPGAGVSYEVVDDLRLGAELHVEVDRESGGTSWAAAGPSVAWHHGNFWLAATYAVGLANIDRAPRLVWGGAF